MRSNAKTVKGYFEALPAERRAALEAVLRVVRKNLPKGYEEAVNWGMPTWQVPLSVYPDTYNKQPLMYAALASQKQYMALYLMNVYGFPALRKELEAGFKKSGKKLDRGKSCIRFRKVEDLPLDVIGKIVRATPVAELVRHAKAFAGRKK